MPRQSYPLYRLQYPDGTLTPPWRLYVPVRIRNPATRKAVNVLGLLDTGADASLFPSALAVRLGHNLKGAGVKSSMTCGIDQTPLTTYRHTFTVELLNPARTRVLRTFRDIEIDCAESDPPVLLGAADFLTRFTLRVCYQASELVLEW